MSFATFLQRVWGIPPKPPARILRAEALSAVRQCQSQHFTEVSDDTPGEGPLNAAGYQHVIEHPAEYYLCSICRDGPWHRSWTGTHRRLRALGPCCSGAD